MKLGYSTKSDRSDWKPFDGSPVPTTPIYIEAREVSSPVVFSVLKGTEVVVKDFPSNSAPYQPFKGAEPYTFTIGAHSVVVKDKNGERTVDFTVASAPQPNQGLVAVTKVEFDSIGNDIAFYLSDGRVKKVGGVK